MTTITVTGIRTTRCTVASGQWFTELETADGVMVDPFLLAIDVPLSDPLAECQAETELARRMVGRRYELEDAPLCSGALVPAAIRELRMDDGQADLFGS